MLIEQETPAPPLTGFSIGEWENAWAWKLHVYGFPASPPLDCRVTFDGGKSSTISGKDTLLQHMFSLVRWCCWTCFFLPCAKLGNPLPGHLTLQSQSPQGLMIEPHGYPRIISLNPGHGDCHSQTPSEHPKGICSISVVCCCLFPLH